MSDINTIITVQNADATNDLHKYFFSERIIDAWNSLPAKSYDFSSLAGFTRFVKKVQIYLDFYCLVLVLAVLAVFSIHSEP